MEKVNYGNFDIFNIFKTENIPNHPFDVKVKISSREIKVIRKEKIDKIWNKKTH